MLIYKYSKLLLLSFLLNSAIKIFVNGETRPNIVFILADDFGYNDIGYHAKDHQSMMKTPHLDHLASNGIKLENYYVQPICTPSRSQLLSGRYQIHTGLQHDTIMPTQPNSLPIENKLLPEQLRDCGYDTHMVGKWHLGFYQSKYLPWKRGFNSYFGYLTGNEDYYTRKRCVRTMCGIDLYSSKDGPVNNTWGEYSAHLFAKKAIKAIDERDKEKSLFLYLAYQSVHRPLQVPERYSDQFQNIKNIARRTYAGMVLAMDESIYNVTQHLADIGILDDTIIVFSTDNGGDTRFGGNNWPLRGRKTTLWEGGVKGVGFVYGRPMGVKHATHRGLLHISDWFPTLLGAVGCSIINKTQSLDGFDQWDAIRQKVLSPRTELLHNIDPLTVVQGDKNPKYDFDTRVQAGIRKGPWKLLTGDPGFSDWVKPPESLQKLDEKTPPFNSGSLVKLFNIEQDPYEHKDVSDQFPFVVNELLSRLAKYNSTAVSVRYPNGDPLANPEFHDGFWKPWLDERLINTVTTII